MKRIVCALGIFASVVGATAGVLTYSLVGTRSELASCRSESAALAVVCRSAASDLRRAAHELDTNSAVDPPQLVLQQTLLPRSSTSLSLIETCARHALADEDRISGCRMRSDYRCIADIARKAAAAIESVNP